MAAGKIARDGAGLTLELEPTRDILAEAVGGRAPSEPTHRWWSVSRRRRVRSTGRATRPTRKGVDLLVANDVAEEGQGFGTDTNRVTLVVPGGEDEQWPLMTKRQVADRLWDRVVAHACVRVAAAGAELAAT